MKKNTLIGLLTAVCSISLAFNFMSFRDPGPVSQKVKTGDPLDCNFTGLPLERVVQMVKQYGMHQTPGINTRLTADYGPRLIGGESFSFVDARAIHFKLDTLENFLCSVRKQVQDNKILDNNNIRITPSEIGIRIYYSAYPFEPGKKSTAKALDKSYYARHTLVFVATYWDSQKKQYIDFDPKPSGISPSGIPYDLTSNSYPGKQPGMFFSPSVTASSDPAVIARDVDGRNHGDLCPPPTPCPTAILTLAGY